MGYDPAECTFITSRFREQWDPQPAERYPLQAYVPVVAEPPEEPWEPGGYPEWSIFRLVGVLEGQYGDITRVGNYIYAEAGVECTHASGCQAPAEHLAVIDVSDPENMQLVRALRPWDETGYCIIRLFVHGHYLWAFSGLNFLQRTGELPPAFTIYDISDPDDPQLVNQIWTPTVWYPEGDWPADFAWIDDYLYMPAQHDGNLYVLHCPEPEALEVEPALEVAFETDPFTPGWWGGWAGQSVVAQEGQEIMPREYLECLVATKAEHDDWTEEQVEDHCKADYEEEHGHPAEDDKTVHDMLYVSARLEDRDYRGIVALDASENRLHPTRLGYLPIGGKYYQGAPHSLRIQRSDEDFSHLLMGIVPGTAGLFAVDVSDPSNMRLHHSMDCGRWPCDADLVGGWFYLKRDLFDQPFWVERNLYGAFCAYCMADIAAYPASPEVGRIWDDWLNIGTHHPGIVGGLITRAGGALGMFTDPKGVQWAVNIGWTKIEVLRRKGDPTEWTTYAAGDIRELPDSSGFDAADIEGDGETLIVLARKASSRHVYEWHSKDEGNTWLGPTLLTHLRANVEVTN